MSDRRERSSSRAGNRPPGAEPAARLEAMVRELRGSLASLRAAAEALELLAGPQDAPGASGLQAVVVQEATRLSRLVDELGTVVSHRQPPRRGGRRLASEVVADFTARCQRELDLEVAAEAVADARLNLDGGRLVDALVGALGHLRQGFAVTRVMIRSRLHEGLLVLDVVWSATEPELWRLRETHGELLAGGARGEPALREVTQTAGGEAWFSVDRAASTAALRLLLPVG